jgi:hypothetical protein
MVVSVGLGSGTGEKAGPDNRLAWRVAMEQFGSAITPTVVSLMDRTPKPAERRSDRRHMTVLRVGKLMAGGGEELCMIRNISAGGLMAHIYAPHEAGEHVAIEIRNGHLLTGQIVWAQNQTIGIEFDERIDVLAFLANEQTDMMMGQVPRSPRLRLRVGALVRRGAHYVHADVIDISQGGLKLTEGEAFDADDDVVVMLGGMPARAGTVRWRKEGHAGIGFNEAIPFEALAQWVAAKGRRASH